jgi:hypothetical protein
MFLFHSHNILILIKRQHYHELMLRPRPGKRRSLADVAVVAEEIGGGNGTLRRRYCVVVGCVICVRTRLDSFLGSLHWTTDGPHGPDLAAEEPVSL